MFFENNGFGTSVVILQFTKKIHSYFRSTETLCMNFDEQLLEK